MDNRVIIVSLLLLAAAAVILAVSADGVPALSIVGWAVALIAQLSALFLSFQRRNDIHNS